MILLRIVPTTAIALLVGSLSLSAQKDTTIRGKHYSHIEYYPGGEVKAVGHLRDSIKVDRWIYFSKKGAIRATGDYSKGSKSGRWTYIDSTGTKRKKNWGIMNLPSEEIVYTSTGELIFYDSLYKSPCLWTYKYGKVSSIARF